MAGTRRTSRGICAFCGGSFGKGAMTRHLATCKERPARRSRKAGSLHLIVEGRYLPQYLLHLEAAAGATFSELDSLLRQTWLECCGHLSAFTVKGVRYTTEPYDDFGFGGPTRSPDPVAEGARARLRELTGIGDLAGFPGLAGLFDEPAEESMDVALGKVLAPDLKCHYEYDFGSTTDLTVRVVAERDEDLRGQPIRILARNEPPELACATCGQPAARICSQCVWAGEGWLCEECARGHECGEEMLLPVVNSPRAGVCGYTG